MGLTIIVIYTKIVFNNKKKKGVIPPSSLVKLTGFVQHILSKLSIKHLLKFLLDVLANQTDASKNDEDERDGESDSDGEIHSKPPLWVNRVNSIVKYILKYFSNSSYSD